MVSASETRPRNEPPVKTTNPLATEASDRAPISVRHRWIGCRRPFRLEGNPRTTIPQDPLGAATMAGADLEARQCSNSAPATAATIADTATASLAIILPS